jgi:hypothetical protein
VDVIVQFFPAVTVDAFTTAQVSVVGLDQKRLHPDKLALSEILERFAITRLLLVAGRNRRAGLEIDECLRRDTFGLSAWGGCTKIVFHLVLDVAVRSSRTLTLETTALVNGMFYLNGGEGQWRSVVAVIGKSSLRESRAWH